jgi:hypothetical protein
MPNSDCRRTYACAELHTAICCQSAHPHGLHSTCRRIQLSSLLLCVSCCRCCCVLAPAVQSHVVGVYALHASLGACGAPQLLAQLDDAVSDTMRESQDRPTTAAALCVLRQWQGSSAVSCEAAAAAMVHVTACGLLW